MNETLKSKTKRMRREHILAAALRVFAERGYRGATIRDIAKAAGVADGTIYNAFSNKADLMLNLIDPLAATLPRDSDLLPRAMDGEDLAGLVRDRFNALTGDGLDMLRVVLSEALVDTEIRKLFYSRVITPALHPLREAIATSSRTDGWGGHDPELASRTIVASVMGFAILRMLGDSLLEQSWSSVPEELCSFFSFDRNTDEDA